MLNPSVLRWSLLQVKPSFEMDIKSFTIANPCKVALKFRL